MSLACVLIDVFQERVKFSMLQDDPVLAQCVRQASFVHFITKQKLTKGIPSIPSDIDAYIE